MHFFRSVARIGFLLLLTCAPQLSAEEFDQVFEGPVQLRIWQHWQPSKNVEQHQIDSSQGLPWQFQLGVVRATAAQPFVQLRYAKMGEFHARLRVKTYENLGGYEVVERSTSSEVVAGVAGNEVSTFVFPGEAFVDTKGKRIVQEYSFEIFRRDGGTEYSYRVLPMHMRGFDSFFWQVAGDPYMAHAGRSGSGGLLIGNSTSTEPNKPYLDRWDGVEVRPTLSFIDPNVLAPGDLIGLHEHRLNQEKWTIISGRALVSHTMAPVSSGVYQVERKWSSAPGDKRMVDQFDAAGGWIERRFMNAGNYMIIVPNPAHQHNVCGHALEAVEPTQMFTEGTKG